MAIRVLAPETAAKIAAGEVIGRPADVVRELIDNSIDAASSQIRVEVRAGGLELIRVVDNGHGVAAGEAATAFERHATSKITASDDLQSISTLGFRGEALPSIAAVSDVTLVTKALDESVGSYLRISGVQVVERGPRACPQGTTLTARNLFQNLPARLKYMRATSAENGQIAQVVQQYALAYPEIRFTLITDGRTSFQSDGTGKLLDAIIKVYGTEVAAAMMPVRVDDAPSFGLHGYVSQPLITRATRVYVSFFVNRRCVQSRMLVHAVEEAYHALLPVGRHPLVVLNIEVPRDELDINVHPAKAEVRFLRERELYGRVQRAVRHSLTERLTVPAMVSQPTVPLAGVQQHLQVVGEEGLAHPQAGKFATIEAQFPTEAKAELVELEATTPVLRVLGQVGSMFIIAEGPNGVFLIDQHRAHERVLYEHLRNERAAAAITTQLLLTPLPVELNSRQSVLLVPRLKDLAGLGFQIELFGERTFLVRAIPATLRQANLTEAIAVIVDQAIEEHVNGDWQERMITTMACKGAIKSGQMLSIVEMRDLVMQLEATSVPPMCPHGGPVMVHLSQAQLERHFGRR